MPSFQVFVVLTALLASSTSTAQTAPAVEVAHAQPNPATLTVQHRKVALLRGTFLGVPPFERAARAEQAIEDILGGDGPGEVTVTDEPQGKVLMIDGALALILVPDDADKTRGQTLETVTQNAAKALSMAILETREARDRAHLAHAATYSAIATFFFALAVWAVWRVRSALAPHLTRLLASRTADTEAGALTDVHRSWLRSSAHRMLSAATWLALTLIAYEWFVYVLTRFAYTRAWGEELGNFLVDIARNMGGSVLRALPDLLVALIILLLARTAVVLARPMFDRAEHGSGSVGWLDRDLAVPSRRIFTTAVWLFAIAMAYPYLPGAQSEAFKGISVLVGLMLTLGGSSLVGQGASGLILMYSRTIRVGEFVRIGDQEGTVTELGTFTTKIRTGLGEEISMPNSLIMGAVTKNYSRTVQGSGYVLDTTLTIGYDTPWRQVEAMLVQAAKRTEGVLASPEPRVFKTGLSDFYVEYRLVSHAASSQARSRAEVMQILHSHILDVFNEHGVQIMSPHYLGDPPQAKLVPHEQWWTAPATRAPASDRP